MKMESIPQIIDFDPFETRTEAEATHSLGEAVILADLRIFRHGAVGASNISVGKLQIVPLPIADHINMTTAAAAIGATSVTVTPGATAGGANLYSEGYLGVNDNTGQGQTFKVKDHLAITASVAFIVNLFDPIKVALDSTSQTSLVHNGYRGLVEGTTSTVRAAGVPLISILAGDYGWFQSKGVASVLRQGTTSAGSAQMVGSTAGSITDITDVTAPTIERVVAWADILVGVDTEYNPVTLCID
jgi:hypothetical protein